MRTGILTRPRDRDPIWRLWLGRDEWGRDQFLDLSGITGITVGGLPRYGKTALVNGLLAQAAPFPAVQFVIIDGKGGSDYRDWTARTWLHCGDDIDQAIEILQQLHTLMRDRQACVRDELGTDNGWHVGPSQAWPLIITVIDECHTFFDPDQAEDDKERRKYKRAQTLVMQLVKIAGSVMMTTICITQKQTGDAIPTKIRDVCTVGLSFATKTRDAAVASLGEAIRDHPSMCPTTLRERPTYIGVCTADLPTTAAPFIRVRIPYLSEADSADVAHWSASAYRNPTPEVVS